VVIGEQDDAQAAQLVRALQDLLREMTRRLAGIEANDAAGDGTPETRSEAAALRRDIDEAKGHIARLQRRYLSGAVSMPT
jgi:acyl-CoA reductase-like NAD-dependent aldehyde dehydrogenase